MIEVSRDEDEGVLVLVLELVHGGLYPLCRSRSVSRGGVCTQPA